MTTRLEWGSLPNIPRIMVEFGLGSRDFVFLLGGDWRDAEYRAALASRRAAAARPPGLGDAVRNSYGSGNISEILDANLDALNLPDTLAVVTGQQVGLFTGPLFTIYKALTVVNLARRLSVEYQGRVVPVFWMETGDSDFSEVNRINAPPEKDAPRRVVYSPTELAAGMAVRHHVIGAEIEAVKGQVAQWFEDAPHRDDALPLLDFYRTGGSLADAFRAAMNQLFGSQGLVMFDPLHPDIARRAAGFWDRCLDRPEAINNSFFITSREIQERRLPLQVKLREDTLPFMHVGEDGRRRRIYGEEGRWQLGKERVGVDLKQLKKEFSLRPGSLAPTALLRPLLQDWLLPTWMYVAGPSEVAYQAQIGRCYDILDIQRPLTVPRAGATLIERSVRRIMDKHGWKAANVIGGTELLLNHHGHSEALLELFDRGAEQIVGWLERVERNADEAGVDISVEVDRSGRKLNYQWNRLREATLKKIMERDRVKMEHARRVSDHIMPDGMMQERHNNVLYYLANYGRGLLDMLDSEIDPFQPLHLVIDLERG